MARIIGFACILMTSLSAFGLQPLKDFPAKGEGDLSFTVDVVRFRNPLGKNLVQVFYDLPYGQLSPAKQEDGGFKVTFKIEVDVKSLATGNAQKDSWVSSGRVSSKEEALRKGVSGIDQFEVELGGGSYELDMTITDVNSKRSGSARSRIDLPELVNVLTLSDLQLATSINVDTAGSRFSRGNIAAVPNPKRVFGDNLPLLYARMEIYNLDFDTTEPGTYSTVYSVLNEEGEVVTSLPAKQTPKPGRTDVEVGAVNVLGLKPGKYQLQVEVKDPSTEQVAKALSSFEVARLKLRRPSMEPWMEEYFSRIDLLVGQDSLRFMKSLSPEGQEQFLIDFWLRRDPTPGTPQNENFDAFALRVKEVDEKYSSGFQKGAKSDRGMIYIKYGKPDDEEYYPADPDYPAHEDWLYYRGGGMQFIFSDITGIGKYELIYSSYEAETYDPNWRQYVSEEFIKINRQ